MVDTQDDNFFDRFRDKTKIELIDYWRYNFPKTWQLFRDCKKEYLFGFDIRPEYAMLVLVSADGSGYFSFVYDYEDEIQQAHYYPKDDKEPHWHIAIDTEHELSDCDKSLSRIIKPILYPINFNHTNKKP